MNCDKYDLFIFIIIWFFFASCLNENLWERKFKDNILLEDISESIVEDSDLDYKFGSDYFTSVREIAVNSTLIAISDNAENGKIHLFDRDTNNYLTTLLGEGRGPNELMNVSSLDIPFYDRNIITAFDLSLQRFNIIKIDSLIPISWNIENITLKSNSGSIYEPVLFGDSLIISLGFFPEGRLSCYNLDGNNFDTIGRIPSQEKIPPHIRQQAWRSKISIENTRERIVLANRFADQIEIYDLMGEHYLLIKGPEQFKAVYSVLNTGDGMSFASGDDLRFGYVDLTVTKNYIYALYSGKTRGEEGPSSHGNQVRIFDWEGSFIKVINFDEPIASISTSDDKILYTLSHLDKDAVHLYNLNL